MNRSIGNLKVGFAGLLASVLTAATSPLAKAELKTQWQTTAQAPQGLMEQFAKDYQIQSKYLSQMSFTRIQVKGQSAPMYLIDAAVWKEFNRFCGSGGCLIALYQQNNGKYSSVFRDVLVSRVPPPYQFVQVSNRVFNGFPCLQFTSSPTWRSTQLNQRTICFDGQKFSYR